MSNRELDSQAATPSHALVATMELESRKQEATRRRARLEENRRALVEVLDALSDEERTWVEQLASAKHDRELLQVETETAARRLVELEGEIESVKRDVAILRRRKESSDTRSQELSEANDDLERQLIVARRALSHATDALETAREALARMDRRISQAGGKR